jgi:hypothetical protein
VRVTDELRASEGDTGCAERSAELLRVVALGRVADGLGSRDEAAVGVRRGAGGGGGGGGAAGNAGDGGAVGSELEFPCDNSAPVSVSLPMGGGGRWTIGLLVWFAVWVESELVGPAVGWGATGELASSAVETPANGNSLDSTAAMAVAFKRAKPPASEPRFAISLSLSFDESEGDGLCTSSKADASPPVPDDSTTSWGEIAAAVVVAAAAAFAASVVDASMDDRRSKRPLAAAIFSFNVKERARPPPVVSLDDAADAGVVEVGLLSTDTVPGVGVEQNIQYHDERRVRACTTDNENDGRPKLARPHKLTTNSGTPTSELIHRLHVPLATAPGGGGNLSFGFGGGSSGLISTTRGWGSGAGGGGKGGGGGTGNGS